MHDVGIIEKPWPILFIDAKFVEVKTWEFREAQN